MACVTLRFYGRFVHAEARRGGGSAKKMSVIAPTFEPRFGRHQTLMTIQRNQVQYGGRQTTLKPMLRTTSAGPILDAELLIWDLSGLTVAYGVSSDVQLRTEGGDVLELRELESLRGRQASLSRSALQARVGGVANAVIEVTAGEGVARPVLEEKVLLATEALALANMASIATAEKDPVTGKEIEKTPADLIEYTVTLPEERDPLLTLSFADAGGTHLGVVTVKAGATVGFSNVCSDLHTPRHFDLEFSQYYGLLQASPGTDGLIPVGLPGALGEGIDCDIQSHITYEEDEE